ncbi:MAG: hypothetical protein WB507_04580 [Solirubrobacterales bacterium]
MGQLELGNELPSGIGPSGEGNNTILMFDPDAPAQPRRLVTDPELSPLDLTVVPNGHIVVASESPFRAPNAVVTVREYDPASEPSSASLLPTVR